MNQPVVYLNGCWLPRSEATLDIEDRGALFGDGVYEVLHYYHGKALAMAEHLARLRDSLAGIRLPEPAQVGDLPRVSDELVARNGLKEAKVYWQITRGPATPRDHAFPAQIRPTVLAMSYPMHAVDPARPPQATTAILVPDQRWHRCAIKSLMLLPNVLARNQALQAGAGEAILHRGPVVTEGSATNLFICRRGELWTHPANQWILAGVTRAILLDLARRDGMTAVERTFTIDELFSADEAFFSGTTTHIAPVLSVDGRCLGRGELGPMTARIYRMFLDHIERVCAS